MYKCYYFYYNLDNFGFVSSATIFRWLQSLFLFFIPLSNT
ncbi:putative membrane protein [Clostridioides difficile P73]|nr:hypothetical protein HMPREF9945_00461 [Clostridioides difficile 70-100-2010]EQE06678.1 putative membrane protein [Clostridioides difficile CD9]EQE15647.1 putative membrane protein [Clostridioides difficile CD8]EQE65170.1 putative membrane protein [Clostridioides difficile CD46]EQF85584.1 putative membrane protein [Clostridioides difficile CD196]EQG46813.1 putative membrane protein [Clostridioides difficile DA00132]EQH58098.1 putative membrane protein [Clostridioides difficile DA00245]EQI3